MPADALIRPVYTVTGGHLGAEGVIAELSGYRGSRPVRVGNNAAHQVQLDVLGPIADLLALEAKQGAALTPEHWRLTESMVDAVATRWMEEDHGIWEIRRAAAASRAFQGHVLADGGLRVARGGVHGVRAGGVADAARHDSAGRAGARLE